MKTDWLKINIYCLVPLIWFVFVLFSLRFPGDYSRATLKTALLPGLTAEGTSGKIQLGMVMMALIGLLLYLRGVRFKLFLRCWMVGSFSSVCFVAARGLISSGDSSISGFRSAWGLDEASGAVALILLVWTWGLYVGIVLSAAAVIFPSLAPKATPVNPELGKDEFRP